MSRCGYCCGEGCRYCGGIGWEPSAPYEDQTMKDGTRDYRTVPGRGAEPKVWTDAEYEAETKRRKEAKAAKEEAKKLEEVIRRMDYNCSHQYPTYDIGVSDQRVLLRALGKL